MTAFSARTLLTVHILCLAACIVEPGGGSDALSDGVADPVVVAAPDCEMAPGTDAGTVTPGTGTETLTAAAPARIRRLTSSELLQTARDVFLAGAALQAAFPSERGEGFDNQYESLSVSVDLAEALQAVAEQVGTRVVASLGSTLPCSVNPTNDATCAGTFIDNHAPRAWRRPVTTAERGRLLGLFTTTRQKESFATSVATVVEALIQSPYFLFRSELGKPGTAPGALTPLGPYEQAAALSYFLWRAPPDAALREAARTGAILEAAELRTQAARLLASDRAKGPMRDFFLQWLGLSDASLLTKDLLGSSPQVSASMVAEATRFIDYTLWSGDARLSTLLRSTRTTVDANVATLYDLVPPAAGQLVTVTLDPQRRSGFLTQPGFIAAHTPGLLRSPIFLGHFVRTRMFCQTIPPPPPGVAEPPVDPTLTTRERFQQHQSDPSCAGCHQLMDPIGFGFEEYDLLGRYRPVENGVTVTGAGQLLATDVDAAFRGPVALADRLASSAKVRSCVAAHLLTYMLGREAAAEVSRLQVDRTSLAAVDFTVEADLKQTILELVSSPAFRLRDTRALSSGGVP